jgi:hypothetical protein
MGNNTNLYRIPTIDQRQGRVNERLFDCERNSVALRVHRKDSTLKAASGAETLRGMFERNVCIVIRPYNPIHRSRQRDKHGVVGQVLDGALHDCADGHVADLKELLLEH